MRKSRSIYLKRIIEELNNINNDYKIYSDFFIFLYNKSFPRKFNGDTLVRL